MDDEGQEGHVEVRRDGAGQLALADTRLARDQQRPVRGQRGLDGPDAGLVVDMHRFGPRIPSAATDTAGRRRVGSVSAVIRVRGDSFVMAAIS
jgi:hypothetical protein